MDSGMSLDEEHRPPFDPLAPLLPEELCYILDRVCSCEVNEDGCLCSTRSPDELCILQCRCNGMLDMLFRKQSSLFNMCMILMSLWISGHLSQVIQQDLLSS